MRGVLAGQRSARGRVAEDDDVTGGGHKRWIMDLTTVEKQSINRQQEEGC